MTTAWWYSATKAKRKESFALMQYASEEEWGNIVRGGSTSGLPRYLEGSRYSAQWYGMPYEVYGGRKGSNDYIDDINTRANAVNYLSGGSVYNPTEKGLGVPLEMTLALHSDAGFDKEDDIIGSLAICTTTLMMEN